MAVSKVDAANQIENQLPQANVANNINFRNLIINGDMSIAQRGTSTASVTATGYNACDRWKNVLNTLGTFTVSQDTDVPTAQGFSKSLKMDCTVADTSPASGDFNAVIQIIEGQNLQYLKKGTSSAESLTLSFWVKSNKTGTYTCEFRDVDNTRSISQTYTISSASTWEKKIITIDGDTTGAFDNDNAGSFQMWFWLGAGSNYAGGTLNTSWNASTTNERVSSSNVNLADSTDNEWYVTGVQLEAGTTASDFEFLPYDVNLQRCQRYFQTIADGDLDGNSAFGTAVSYNATTLYYSNPLKVTMRTTPTLYQITGTDYFKYYRNGAADSFNSLTIANSNNSFLECFNITEVSGISGQAGFVRTNNSSAFIGVNAEL